MPLPGLAQLRLALDFVCRCRAPGGIRPVEKVSTLHLSLLQATGTHALLPGGCLGRLKVFFSWMENKIPECIHWPSRIHSEADASVGAKTVTGSAVTHTRTRTHKHTHTQGLEEAPHPM